MDRATLFNLALVIGFETLAQYYLQKKVSTQANMDLYLSMAAYAMVPYFYYFILESGTALGTADALFNAGSQLTIAAMGYLVFKQSLSRKQMLGIALIMAGVNFAS